MELPDKMSIFLSMANAFRPRGRWHIYANFSGISTTNKGYKVRAFKDFQLLLHTNNNEALFDYLTYDPENDFIHEVKERSGMLVAAYQGYITDLFDEVILSDIGERVIKPFEVEIQE